MGRGWIIEFIVDFEITWTLVSLCERVRLYVTDAQANSLWYKEAQETNGLLWYKDAQANSLWYKEAQTHSLCYNFNQKWYYFVHIHIPFP